MAARIKKADPELLLVSFCDILTISISALFMATIITVFEATKVPELSMTPRAAPSDKQPVFFECRNNEVFIIDKARLDDQVAELMNTVAPGVKSGDMGGFLKALQGRVVTNYYYKVNPSYLLAAIMALDAKPDVSGETIDSIEQRSGKYQITLENLNTHKQFAFFLVRDDSFPAFRKARELADKKGFDTGWELLGINEPIKFGAGGQGVTTQ
jgi:hypothetical protein